MPPKTSKSGLVGKLGNKGAEAFEAHKNDEVNYGGGGSLPEGIEDGIAQLSECKFSQYEKGPMKGEYFFYSGAIVVSPEKAAGRVIKGLRTSIMEPMCATPTRSRKTVEDHVAWVLNEFKKLGVDTSELSFDDFEATAAALKEAKPYIAFRTWKGEPSTEYPNPRVNEQWKGLCEYSPDEKDDGVIDESGADPADESDEGDESEDSELDDLLELANNDNDEAKLKLGEIANGLGISEKVFTSTKTWEEAVELIKKAKSESDSQSSEGEDEGDAVDYEALGKAANSDDEDAITKLTELGEEMGISVDDHSDKSWSEFATFLSESSSSEGKGEGEGEAEAWAPKEEQVYEYTPLDKNKKPILDKNKKPKKVECEVISVDEDNETVTLKNLDDDNTVYKNVKWKYLIRD